MALHGTPEVQRPSALTTRLEAASRRAASLGMVPPGAISLAMGEPFGDTPAPVREAAIRALRDGRTRYAPLTGSPGLREGLAQHLSAATATRIDPAQVTLTHGASAGLAAAILTVVDPGDVVLLPEPTYSLYADHVALAGGRAVWVANGPDGNVDLEAVCSRMPGAALVVMCSPSNPTGRVLPRQELESLAAAAAEYDTLLLCDEAYSDIVFDGREFFSSLRLPSFTANVICCGTFSKSYAMTGWRLGYVISGPELAARINHVHRTLNGALNTFVQDAAHAALNLPDEFLAELVTQYQCRRDLVVGALNSLPFVTVNEPEGAFYAFPHIDSTYNSQELADLLATRGGVLVRSGWEYGPSGEGHVRLSFATDMTSLEEGLDRFVTTLTALVA